MGKFLATIYGISTYLLFLVTALYMIGFLGNFAVPKSISSGVETSFSKGILINLLLLSVFAIQHSLMARQSFKKWLTSFMNPAVERSTYVLLSDLLVDNGHICAWLGSRFCLYLYDKPL